MKQPHSIPNDAKQPLCILRLPEVERRTGYKRAHIYNLMRQAQFPKNIRLGTRAVGWNSEEIEQWIVQRLAQHD